MLTIDQWKQAAKSLRFAAQLLNEGDKFTDIELMACFRRGVAELEERKQHEKELAGVPTE